MKVAIVGSRNLTVSDLVLAKRNNRDCLRWSTGDRYLRKKLRSALWAKADGIFA